MTQHTPGPWAVLTAAKYGADADHPAVVKDEGDGIPWCIIASRVIGPDAHQARANARLIAAAPEMLEFIRAEANIPDPITAYRLQCRDDARALLARIEGKE